MTLKHSPVTSLKTTIFSCPKLTTCAHRRNGTFPPENPCRNSGTTGPAEGPVVPLFPQPPFFRGHNSANVGNRAGIIPCSMAGMGEVIFSNVTVIAQWRGCGLGRDWNTEKFTYPVKSPCQSQVTNTFTGQMTCPVSP
jgi:hypothetical protein